MQMVRVRQHESEIADVMCILSVSVWSISACVWSIRGVDVTCETTADRSPTGCH